MTHLLDTHTFIWAMAEPKKLSVRARGLIEDPTQHIVVSAVTFWEIALKYSLGKLHVEGIQPEELPAICEQMGFEIIPLDAETCASYHFLKAPYHRDPFDKMLIWLSVSRRFALISKDKMVRRYQSAGLQVMW